MQETHSLITQLHKAQSLSEWQTLITKYGNHNDIPLTVSLGKCPPNQAHTWPLIVNQKLVGHLSTQHPEHTQTLNTLITTHYTEIIKSLAKCRYQDCLIKTNKILHKTTTLIKNQPLQTPEKHYTTAQDIMMTICHCHGMAFFITNSSNTLTLNITDKLNYDTLAPFTPALTFILEKQHHRRPFVTQVGEIKVLTQLFKTLSCTHILIIP